MPGSARKDALRSYVMLAGTDGEFKGIFTPAGLLMKGIKILTEDLTSILGEMTQVVLEMNDRPLAAVAVRAINNIVSDIFKRGPKPVWNDMKAQYKRGMDINARRGGK